MLSSADAVLAVEPARYHAERIDIGLVGHHAVGGPADIEVRALFSDAHGGLVEDPVTGSLNAAIAQWLFASGGIDRDYVAAQGTRLGRSGRVRIKRASVGQVWIGGRTRTLFAGVQGETGNDGV